MTGLLAAVAQAMAEAGVRVHDARIATFGERAEDFFLVTNRNDQPLSLPQQDQLLHKLLERINR